MLGNQQKMREALVAIQKLVQANIASDEFDDLEPLKEYVQIRDICNAALSAPARQCDVGTADEQNDRFLDFCSEYHDAGCYDCDGNPLCPVAGESDCKLAWAQMPYEAEEGAGK